MVLHRKGWLVRRRPKARSLRTASWRMSTDVHHLYPDSAAYPGLHLRHHQVPALERRFMEDVEEDYHQNLAL